MLDITYEESYCINLSSFLINICKIKKSVDNYIIYAYNVINS